MQKKSMSHFMTGVAVPVFALRTRQSCGVGEFADLVDLGRWCVEVGLEVIQILPVNDTGADPSPYSLSSAFALHPLYVRLESIAGAAAFRDQIEAFRICHQLDSRLDYAAVLAFKTTVLRAIYARYQRAICTDEGLLNWIRHNPWARIYAVFCTLQQAYAQQPWQTWSDWQEPMAIEIESFFDTHANDTYFYAWVQWQLEQQLHAAAEALDDMGVSLKGDLPVLLNQESADVWAQRPYFDMSVVAGAPPDMFSPLGQNWGFPVYVWEAHRQDNFRWWRARLTQAAKFFHAFRIDHVLGFFRIWQIPRSEASGLMGHYDPACPITVDDLDAQFDAEHVRWLSMPHVAGRELQGSFVNDAKRIRERYLEQPPEKDWFYIKPEFASERALNALPEPEAVRDFLTVCYRDRVLIPVSPNTFAPAWFFYKASAFASLSAAQQKFVDELVAQYYQTSETVWEAQARELLGMMAQATDMLVCAEDLGAVPACVPQVLQSLDMLSLRIERWTRDYAKPDAPYIDLAQYPRLSVCTPSVHDTSTLRLWWHEPECDRAVYARRLGLDGIPPEDLTPELCQLIIERQLTANSILCIFQIQDLFALTADLRTADPQDERINVPGTTDTANWSYRIPVTLAELARHEDLNRLLMALIAARRQRRLA